MIYSRKSKNIAGWSQGPVSKTNSANANGRGLNGFTVLALVAAHNEGDIIRHVLGDLISQGLKVYFIDNNSTDNTVAEASFWLGKGLVKIELFPSDAGYPVANESEYVWSDILKRKEELAATLEADWFIHHDADEFRESPIPFMRLKTAIYLADSLGFNALDFFLLNFRPTEENFVPGDDVRKYLTWWEEGEGYNQMQVKAWKNTRRVVDLVSTGGHDVSFEGRKVFPLKFILRHYPIRGQEHGMEKVFRGRKDRFNDEERSRGWHVQYDCVSDDAYQFIRSKEGLKAYTTFSKWTVRLRVYSQQLNNAFVRNVKRVLHL